ncbi:hypothetical protein S40285_04657 [Stachybotrys chlorohalonatus IBT 40285]|uniref:non-specific serine/threonine protein kinase n=1 Tax=Stachybotrys chlorohalonatus (strain IBT 40285) TaxID=1283841 RepID=A0A084QPF5_STAC4|nr:hypothetical protein S40285_04657 [Stachybotrys chlorohalonata IBT 40285]
MSLIPYNPREGREIVLRHRNAIVVRDSASQRLEIRGLPECPTCHQPLPRNSSDRPFEHAFEMGHESYVNPDYFRMLRARHHNDDNDQYTPSSPIRRLFQPALASSSRAASASSASGVIIDDDAEFVSSTPGVAQAEGSKIRREAFSPNYFSTFFVEEKVLGKGGKGVVLLVRHEIDGCQLGHFACKRVPVGDDHAWLEKVLVEVELLAKLSHPNLVSYRHVWLEDVRLTRFGPTVACAFILQQYCNGGDLHQYVIGSAPRETTKEELKARMRRRSKGRAEASPVDRFAKAPLSFEMIYSLFKDITSGVAYLHAANYIHRDLKPSNCLLHQEGTSLNCLISDFGEVQPENVVRKSTGSTGTISYCAPEVLKVDATGHYGNFTTKSDVFSLGMILYFMCFGRLPYRSANALQEELEDVDELRAEITDWQGFHGERRERPDLPSKLYALLKKLLSLDPAERPSAADVLNAMTNESSLDGMTQDRPSSPPVDLRGGRVQNLDSPATPGTPTPDNRRRHPRIKNTVLEDGSPWTESPLQDESPSTLRQRRTSGLPHNHPTSMTMARSQDRFDDHAVARSSTESEKEGSDDGSVFTAPPLLMAPPSRGLDGFRHRIMVGIFMLAASLGWDPAQLGYLTRLVLFLVKLSTLARSCWPYMTHFQVSIPLVIIASIDLALPVMIRSSSLTVRQHRSQSGRGVARVWGIGTSLGLLILHLSALRLAHHWGSLCASLPRQDHWHGWEIEGIDTQFEHEQ